MNRFDFTDCLGFAGAMSLGLTQSGGQLRSVLSLDDFGVPNLLQNRRLLGDAWEPETRRDGGWTPAAPVGLFAGNPPCSGFSIRSTSWRVDGARRGPTAPVNHCMTKFVEAAADHTGLDGRKGPELVVFESVPQAYTNGRRLMQRLWRLLGKRTQQAYALTHLPVDHMRFGAAQRRPRYLWIAHRIGLRPAPLPVPRGLTVTYRDRIGHRPWGRMRLKTPHAKRAESFAEECKWPAGIRLYAAVQEWTRQGRRLPAAWEGYDPSALTDMGAYGQAYRFRSNDPPRVVYGRGDILYVRPSHPRALSVEETAALMGYPEDWDWTAARGSQEAMTWLGKQVPVECGRWIGATARLTLEARDPLTWGARDERTITIDSLEEPE